MPSSHYLNQCWPRSLPPYGVTGPQWVKFIALQLQISSAQPLLTLTRFKWYIYIYTHIFHLVSYHSFSPCHLSQANINVNQNKANLRDLIAATGLVILLKFYPIHRFFSPCDLEIWCMTLKNNRAPLLYYIKLCVSFQIHRWIQTKVTVRKPSIWVKIGDFLSCVTLKFDG